MNIVRFKNFDIQSPLIYSFDMHCCITILQICFPIWLIPEITGNKRSVKSKRWLNHLVFPVLCKMMFKCKAFDRFLYMCMFHLSLNWYCLYTWKLILVIWRITLPNHQTHIYHKTARIDILAKYHYDRNHNSFTWYTKLWINVYVLLYQRTE